MARRRRPQLIILSVPQDATVPMVLRRLPADLDWLWWDEGTFPADASLVTRVNDGAVFAELTYDGSTYDLTSARAGWLRRPRPPTAGAAVSDPEQRRLVEQVARYHLAGLWQLLDIAWLPGPPERWRDADNKLRVLAIAARLGLEIPDTSISNSPNEVVRLWDAHGGRLIAKSPTDPVDFTIGGERHVLFTTAVTRRDLRRLLGVRHTSVILQPNVAKAVELRATVVGEEMFTAEIRSQGSVVSRQDWRRQGGRTLTYAPHELPPPVADRCVSLVRELGLAYGAIDMILTP